MRERWVARHDFSWPLTLSFRRRRLDLLDWLDTGVNVVQFFDDGDSVGVAVGQPSQRVIIGAEGMSVSLSDPSAQALGVVAVVKAVFETIRPDLVVHHRSAFRLSESLDSGFEHASVALAKATTGLPSAVDVAVLADVRTDEDYAQIEYGIVDGEQLAARLAGVLDGPREFAAPALMLPADIAPFPDCAVYSHLLWNTIGPTPVEDELAFEKFVERAESSADKLMDSVLAGFSERAG